MLYLAFLFVESCTMKRNMDIASLLQKRAAKKPAASSLPLVISPVETAEMSSSPAPAPAPSPREHVERIRRERYFIGRGEQNPLAEDMHQAVNYLSQELYSKDVHFLMELVQVSTSCFLAS